MTSCPREPGTGNQALATKWLQPATPSSITGHPPRRVVNATRQTVTRSRSRFSQATCNYNENAPRARTSSSGKSACPVPGDDFILDENLLIASRRNRSRLRPTGPRTTSKTGDSSASDVGTLLEDTPLELLLQSCYDNDDRSPRPARRVRAPTPARRPGLNAN